jgi:hypothetical protein
VTSDGLEAAIRAQLAGLYRPEGVEAWLRAPNLMLGRRRPVDLIRDGQAAQVLEVVEQLTSGALS